MLSLKLGLGLVGVLALLAFLGPWLAPYPPNEQLDPASASERPPGTELAAVALSGGRWWLADHVERTPAGLLVERRQERRELPADEVLNLTATGVADRRAFLLGTDRYGRDLLSRLLHGLRLSLLLALGSGAIAIGLGLAIGSLAATSRPWVDACLMRFVDVLLAFPKLFLVLALAALFHPSTWLLALVLGSTRWMTVSRLVRAEVRETAERDFVAAARGLGLPRWRILTRHLLPSSLAPVLVAGAIVVGNVVLAESLLSFLGFGVQPPAASLGSIINDGQSTLTTAWWVSALPGLVIIALVSGFSLLADGLRDYLDPRIASQDRDRTVLDSELRAVV